MTLVLLKEDAAPKVVSRVPQGEARREHTLRDLIYDNPTMMPVHELDPSYGRLFTVAKELNIPGVGFVDVLLADERGRLVVVECKLWRNPQARREVVGQILDYARELSRYGYDDLQRQISIATKRPGNMLYELARAAGSSLRILTLAEQARREELAGQLAAKSVADDVVKAAEKRRAIAHETADIEKESQERADKARADREKAIKDFESRVIGAEGTGKNGAGSSAAGYGQFTAPTYLALYKQRFGNDGVTDSQILDTRNREAIAKGIIDAYTRSNANDREAVRHGRCHAWQPLRDAFPRHGWRQSADRRECRHSNRSSAA